MKKKKNNMKTIKVKNIKLKIKKEFDLSKYRLDRYNEITSVLFIYTKKNERCDIIKKEIRQTDKCIKIKDGIYCVFLHNLKFSDAMKVSQKIYNKIISTDNKFYGSIMEIEKNLEIHSLIVKSIQIIESLFNKNENKIEDMVYYNNLL